MVKKIIRSIALLSIVVIASAVAVIVVINGPGGLAQGDGGFSASAGASSIPDVARQSLFIFTPEEVVYEVSQPTYSWIDISASSDEQIAEGDPADNLGSAAIEIGFYFPFFEEIYRQVRVSDNGYLYFGGDETHGANAPQAVPSDVDLIHNLIAPFGADLFRYPGDSVVYIARQTDPERRLVLQFEKAYWCCNLEAANDFQVVLYPDGRILTQYQSIGQSVPHAYLTAGIENKDGTRGYNFYTGFLDEAPMLQGQQAVLYGPGDTLLGRMLFIPEAVTVQGTPTETATLSADLLNLSGTDSYFTITHTLRVNGLEILADPGQPEEPAWRFNILTEPGLVSNTDFAPLTVEVTVPETAALDDTAIITFQALPDTVQGFTPTVTFTVIVTDTQP
jgi:hypothetical protein